MKFINLKHYNFTGVFDKDNYILNKNYDICIINNTFSYQKNGEHWIVLFKNNDNLFYYDSFGRTPLKAKIGNIKKLKQMDKDNEQSIMDINCGSRCISFIITLDLFNDYKKVLKAI